MESRRGSVNTHYLLETVRGKFLVKIDEVKSEIEVKRELDLLLFLRKHGFPCPEPLADRKGRHYRELGGKCISVYRYIDGHSVDPDELTLGQLENVGRVLADLHLIGKAYKKGVDNRFSFERVAEIYADVRGGCRTISRRSSRTLDEELEYLQNYLEKAAEGHHPRRPVLRQRAASRARRSSPCSTSRRPAAASSSSTWPPR